MVNNGYPTSIIEIMEDKLCLATGLYPKPLVANSAKLLSLHDIKGLWTNVITPMLYCNHLQHLFAMSHVQNLLTVATKKWRLMKQLVGIAGQKVGSWVYKCCMFHVSSYTYTHDTCQISNWRMR